MKTRPAKKTPLPRKHTPLMILCDGTLLLLALLGSVLCFTRSFQLPVDEGILLVACLCAAALFLAVASLPKLRWLVWLTLLALFLYGMWLVLPQLVRGEIAVRCAVVNTFAFHWPFVDAITPLEQLPNAVWLRAATLFMVFTILPLAFLLSIAIVRARSFWLTFFITFPFVLAELSMLLAPPWLPLLALLLCWAGLLLPALSVGYDPSGNAKLTLLALPPTAAFLGLLLLLLPPTNYQRPLWADRAQADILRQVSNWGDALLSDLPTTDGPFTLAGGSSQVSLAKAGPLNFRGGTVLRVKSDLRGRIYLRGFSSARYVDGSWQLLEENAYDTLCRTSPPDSLYSSVQPDPSAYQPMNFPAMAQRNVFPDKPYAKVTVENVAANSAFVYHPYHILTTPDQLGGSVFLEDYALGRADGVREHTVYIQPDCDPLSRVALSGDTIAAERRYAAFVSAVYTEVPSALAETLWSLWEGYTPNHAALTAQFPDHYTDQSSYRLYAAQAVADFLAERCTYNPDTAATPVGQDSVLYFLEESREGYCMHFASSAVLLLRHLGIPTRYVSGYVADIGASGRANVPDSNAHAWVEVYLDGYGWEPIEVTPPYAGGQPGQSGEAPQPEETPIPTATPSPAQAPVGDTVSPTPSPTPTPTPTPVPQGSGGNAFDLRWLLIPAALLLLVLSLCLRRFLATGGRRKCFAQADPNRCAIAAYLYLCQLAPWGGAVPQPMEDLAKRAKFSQHTLSDEERDSLLNAAQQTAKTVDKGLPPHKKFWFRYVCGLY